MSLLKKRPIRNRLPTHLCKGKNLLRPIRKIGTSSTFRQRETGLSFVDDFTSEHSHPGLHINFTEIPGIF